MSAIEIYQQSTNEVLVLLGSVDRVEESYSVRQWRKSYVIATVPASLSMCNS
jgi:hypothetical protein